MVTALYHLGVVFIHIMHLLPLLWLVVIIKKFYAIIMQDLQTSGWFCGSAVVVGGLGLRPNLEIPPQSAGGNQPEECSRGAICIGYHWVLSDLSGKAEKRSKSEMRTNYCMNERVMAGEGG